MRVNQAFKRKSSMIPLPLTRHPVIIPIYQLAFMVNGDGITIGNRNDFGWPGKTGGRYGKEEEKKGEVGTTHAGLSWLMVALRCLPHQYQESNPDIYTYKSVMIWIIDNFADAM